MIKVLKVLAVVASIPLIIIVPGGLVIVVSIFIGKKTIQKKKENKLKSVAH